MKKRSFETYPLRLVTQQTVQLESEYKIIGVAEQDGKMELIVEIYDTPGGTVPVNIEVFGTGQWRRDVGPIDNYIGNARVAGILWHVSTPDPMAV